MTTKKFNRPHIIIPEEDTTWAVDQKPCVMRFWQQCWLADPYGSRWMKLVTNLSDSAFRFARRVLEAARLFVFRRVSYSTDRSSVWEVLNLHGARVKDFWQNEKNEADTALFEADTATLVTPTASNEAEPKVERQSEQELQQTSVTLQEHISNSSEELLMCEENTLAHEIPESAQTATAPLRGASPLGDEWAYGEEKESVMGLIEGNESIMSGACPTSLNSRDDHTLPDQDNCSAVAPPPVEKWSSEARAARMQLRPGRMDKLRRAGIFGDHPGFTYLQECWDDPSLRIMVRRLIVKFPQWKVAFMNEELVDWGDA